MMQEAVAVIQPCVVLFYPERKCSLLSGVAERKEGAEVHPLLDVVRRHGGEFYIPRLELGGPEINSLRIILSFFCIFFQWLFQHIAVWGWVLSSRALGRSRALCLHLFVLPVLYKSTHGGVHKTTEEEGTPCVAMSYDGQE